MVNDSIGVKLRLLVRIEFFFFKKVVRIELIMKYICFYIVRIEK